MKRVTLLVALAGVALATPAWSWWPKGHGIVAEGAVRALPAEVPAFFRSGWDMVAHCSQDPDVAKNRDAHSVREAEEPEHFLDFELLQGRPLPPSRYEFLKLCHELKVDPQKAGVLPYSITEWTERLAVAFAEHRKWPENPYIRTKCLLYAGFLAHYAGDLCMPLHTTIHYDGRARENGSSPRTGIHAAVDSLIERLELKPEELAAGQRVEAADRILPAVLAEFQRSHALVGRVYELEAKLPPREGEWTPGPEVRAFTTERARAATRFLASLYLTAWRKSEKISLPAWLERENVRKR